MSLQRQRTSILASHIFSRMPVVSQTSVAAAAPYSREEQDAFDSERRVFGRRLRRLLSLSPCVASAPRETP
jgi:hypothetical protein